MIAKTTKTKNRITVVVSDVSDGDLQKATFIYNFQWCNGTQRYQPFSCTSKVQARSKEVLDKYTRSAFKILTCRDKESFVEAAARIVKTAQKSADFEEFFGA